MESVCINNTVQCRVMLTEQEVNLTEQGEMHIELHPRLECVAHFYDTNLTFANSIVMAFLLIKKTCLSDENGLADDVWSSDELVATELPFVGRRD